MIIKSAVPQPVPDKPGRKSLGHTPVRYFRIPDDLWHAAQARAERDGTTVSALVREWLSTYVSTPVWAARSTADESTTAD